MKNAISTYEETAPRTTPQVALCIKTGFTIVELLVIIVVIVILASVALVSYNAVTKRSQLETAKSDAQTAAAAINKYKAEIGTYPTALTQVSIATTQSTLNYVPDGTGASYCVSATFKDQVANAKAGTVTANEGSCPAATGPITPPTITNAATNPSAENDLTGVTGYSGGVARRVGAGAASGNTSFAVTTTSGATAQGLIHFVTTATPGVQYTCAMSFKGTDGVSIKFAGRFTTAANAFISEGAGSRTFALSSTAWTRKTIQFTTPVTTGNALIQYTVVTPAAGVTIQTDALMCTQGTTDYNYADGDATGWAWVGARQQSASSGPSTGVAPAN